MCAAISTGTGRRDPTVDSTIVWTVAAAIVWIAGGLGDTTIDGMADATIDTTIDGQGGGAVERRSFVFCG